MKAARRSSIACVVTAMFLGSGVSSEAGWEQIDGLTAASVDDAAMQTLWSRLDASWNARDAKRFSEVFASDGSLKFGGRDQSLETRAAILQHFESQFSQQSPELRHRTETGKPRLITARTAAVDGYVEISRKGSVEKTTVLRRFEIFAVLQQSGEGDWQIRLLRAYLIPQEPAADTNH